MMEGVEEENPVEEPEEFIENVKLELISGNKNKDWLVIDDVHIAYMYEEWSSTVVWRCSDRRRLGCTFTMVTTKPSRQLG